MNTKGKKYVSAISLGERIKFLRLLVRWKGSVWKLLWADFLWFIFFYIGITLLYRLYLIHYPEHRRIFEATVAYMNKAAELIPLSFVLGFFVSTVLERWWFVIHSIPGTTDPAFTCQALITGDKVVTLRDTRVTVVRYLNLAWILSIINISKKIKNRFTDSARNSCCPKLLKSKKLSDISSTEEKLKRLNDDPVVQKSFGEIISKEEIAVFENLEGTSQKPSFVIPLMWATRLLERSLKTGLLKSESAYIELLNMIQNFETNLANLAVYNEFNMPLVYTQVIIIVVYTFLITEIFSQQVITSNSSPSIEVYFPLYTIFKFLIYMGWFKVGLCFINPFGDEAEDLPLDHMLDFNLEESSLIASRDDKYFPGYLTGLVTSDVPNNVFFVKSRNE